jgi:predicted RNA-binding Zn ribbon-like protein
MSGEPSPSVCLVRDFVNTAEPQLGTDQLVPSTAPESLQRLGLVAADAHVPADELSLLVGVREGLRQVLLDHAGHDAEAAPLSDLDELLNRVPLTLGLATGTAVLRAIEDRAAHRVIAAVLSAVITTPPEEWARLKVCARDSCRWAFFDTSRNRSGRWCSMAGCGNIVKMRRAYRTRTARTTAQSHSSERQPGHDDER